MRRLDGGIGPGREREQIGPAGLAVLVEAKHLETAPEAAEGEPQLALLVLKRAPVDGVEVLGRGGRALHVRTKCRAEVGPIVGGSERGFRRVSDAGLVRTEFRG